MKATSKYLLKALFKRWNHCHAVLPYNLNWQIKLGPHEKHFLNQNPLVLCDVGARGSAPEELAPFYSHMVCHNFDADKEECDRQNALSHPYHEIHVFPYYIGRDRQKMIFNVYEQPGESSSYNPGKRFQDVFGGNSFAIEKEIEVTSTSLNEAYLKEAIVLPDFLKLDTQGSELEILRNAETIINNTCLIEVEVEFLEMYEGQPLCHDVFKFMFEQGFELLYLNRVFGSRRKIFKGPSRGQLIFGDALFGRREDCLGDFSNVRIVKYILLLINYGHIDFADHLLKLHPDIEREFPMLTRMIFPKNKGSKFKRMLFSQLDKLILLLLHIRKFNQLSYDSDRSWPIR